ncbi:MAG: PE-PPE domain-containing protein [Mycobacterium kyogaense]|uniref:PE-PPE domain-containing protein n=1 Tax=Mycobacterium kyogaense TaxID=2212479 RepID=UPI002FFB594A
MNFTAKRARVDSRQDRDGLVASARQTFADVGPTASMADIADAAGVSTDDLYSHFGDRDGLLVAVLEDLEQSLREPEPRDRRSFSFPGLSARYVVPPVVAAAAVLSVTTAPPSTAAAVDPPPASSVVTISPLWPIWSLDTALQGSLCADNICNRLDYVPFVTGNGVRALDRELSQLATSPSKATGDGPTVVLGFSNGAGVAEEWMAEHSGVVGAPSPDEVSFVLIGNPRRAYGGIMPPIAPTDYHVIDVVRQYDPLADFPDRPLNLLALANVAAGMLSPMHLDYRGVDLDDPNNVVWTEGNTTYVFVPTTELPLLKPLRALGFDELAAKLNGPLTEIIEKAYDRPYLDSPEPAPVVAPEPEKTVLAAATEESEPVTPKRRTLFAKHAVAEDVSADADAEDTPRHKKARSDDDRQQADTPTVTAPPTSDGAAASTPTKKTQKRWGHHRDE